MIMFFKRDRHLYPWLSNFFRCDVNVGNITYLSAEHAYQAMKCGTAEAKLKISRMLTPLEAKCAGNKVPLNRNWWTDYRKQAMRIVVRAKFTQNLELAKRLLETGNKKLVEDSLTNYFWGVGRDESGKNVLGLLLMEIREDIRREYDDDDSDKEFVKF